MHIVSNKVQIYITAACCPTTTRRRMHRAPVARRQLRNKRHAHIDCTALHCAVSWLPGRKCVLSAYH